MPCRYLSPDEAALSGIGSTPTLQPTAGSTRGAEVARASLLERAREDGLSELWIQYHDLSGRPQVKNVPPHRWEAAVAEGVSFARANFDFNVLDEQVPDFVFGAETGDFMAVPDPDTYARIPHHPGAARVYSFLHDGGGRRWAGCARAAVRAMEDKLASRGLKARAAFEPECYLLARTAEGPKALPRAGMFSVSALESQHELMSKFMRMLGEMGVVLEQVAPEYGPGQYEINIGHQPPLKASDDLMTVREELRALARVAGCTVSFMPKISREMAGSGMHVHLGLTSIDDRDAMEGDQVMGLSEVGAFVVAGILKHARGLCGLAAPTVNSYKRLQPASWAPSHICFGGSNRAALVRLPDAGARHVEFRAGDGTGNPYLTLVGLLAAALDGIEQRLPPGDPITDGIGQITAPEASARGLLELPRSAPDALDALEGDEVLMDALGPVIGPTFLRLRRSEAATYALEVSDWERAAYLEHP